MAVILLNNTHRMMNLLSQRYLSKSGTQSKKICCSHRHNSDHQPLRGYRSRLTGVRLPTNPGHYPRHNLFTRSHRLLSCTRGNNMFPRSSKGVAGCINRRSHNRHNSSPNCSLSNMHLPISMYRDHGEMLPRQRIMAGYNHIQRAGRLAAIIPRPGYRQVVALTAGGIPANMVRCQIPATMEMSGSIGGCGGSVLWWSRLVIKM